MQSRSACPIGKTLDIIGDRWSLLILRWMIYGKNTTYSQIAGMPENIASNILSERLDRLEAVGIVVKTVNSADRRKYLYHVTEKGLDLIPVMTRMIEWGMKYNEDAWYPKSLFDQVNEDFPDLIEEARRLSTTVTA